MFPLKSRLISGYRFGQRTWYTKKHLGVDYSANFEPLYAPFDGIIERQFKGKQGGKTIWFKPKGQDIIIRFMHLSEFKTNVIVKQGDIIAITGNSGLFTTGVHCHIDISKNNYVNIYNFNNFINPELYDWEKGNNKMDIIKQIVNAQKQKLKDITDGKVVFLFSKGKTYIVRNGKKTKIKPIQALVNLLSVGVTKEDLDKIK